ncbi:MAG: hypothetical protein ACFFC7_08825 [Candidatus Hermodarchaeota archaeon]
MAKGKTSVQEDLDVSEEDVAERSPEELIAQRLKDNLGIDIQPSIPDKAKNKKPLSVTIYQGLDPMIKALKDSKMTGPVLRALLLDAMFKAGLMPTVYQSAVKKEKDEAGALLIKFLASKKFNKAMKECIDLLEELD